MSMATYKTLQRAGSVMHFIWVANSIEELIDVLAR